MLVLVAVLAFVFEVIDAALGQGYGTLGSPTLILLGIDPKVVVPAILLSQAIGGLTAAVWHNKWKNADFSNHKTLDFKKVYVVVVAGIVGVLVASFLGFKVSKDIMTTYIGVVVLVMGTIIISGIVLPFTWKKMAAIGAVSAFNKGLSGGGYGPVVAGGQVIIGVGGKPAVGVTDLAEAPICITGFLAWTFLGGLVDWQVLVAMTVGAFFAPFLGAWITYKMKPDRLKKVLGWVIIVLGVLTLLKVLNP